jgi:hypothetical protein
VSAPGLSPAVRRLLVHMRDTGDGWMQGDPVGSTNAVLAAERRGLVFVERDALGLPGSAELTERGAAEARLYP